MAAAFLFKVRKLLLFTFPVTVVTPFRCLTGYPTMI